MGEIHDKAYMLDTEELREWSRIPEAPADSIHRESDEQCLQERIIQKGLEPGLDSAVHCHARLKVLHVRDLAARLKRSPKWVYAHGVELGGTRVGRSWIFTEEGLEIALLGQRQEPMARDRQMERTKIQKGVQSQTQCGRVGSADTERLAGTGDPEDTRDPNRHGLSDPL